MDVGRKTPCPENLVVTHVETLETYVTTEMLTTFVATIQNYGENEISDGRGTFVLDGKDLEGRSFFLKPGGTASVTCTTTLHEPGFHHVTFDFRPTSVKLGLGLGVAAWLIWVLVSAILAVRIGRNSPTVV